MNFISGLQHPLSPAKDVCVSSSVLSASSLGDSGTQCLFSEGHGPGRAGTAQGSHQAVQRTADGQCQAAPSQARPAPAIPTAVSSEFILNYTDGSAASPALLRGGLRPPQGLGIMPWALLSSACHLPVFDLYFLCIYCSNFEFLPS